MIVGVAIPANLVPAVATLLILALYLLFPVLIGAAVYGAQRYKLTRTRLRGIRFGLVGSAWNHGLKALGYPTLGLVWFWYRACEHRYTLSHLSAGNVRFEVTESDMSLELFIFVNALIFLFTLGLGLPWVVTRTLRHLGENLRVSGAIDDSRIRQAQEESQAVGEGFVEALDPGVV